MAKNLEVLAPYLFSEKKFSDEKNHQTINTALSQVTAKLKNITRHSQIQTQGRQLTIKELQDQMVVALYHFTTQKKSLARMEVTSLLNLCIHCHTQTAGSTTSKLFDSIKIEKMGLNKFEQAEVYFLTREYDKALSILKKLVITPSEDDLDTAFVREKSLNFLLTYYLRLESDLEGTDKLLKEIEEDKNAQKFIVAKIREWRKELQTIKTLAIKLDSLKSDKEIEQFIDQNLAKIEQDSTPSLFENNEIGALYFSGILNQYLEKSLGAKLQSKILYWLAIYDKRLNSQLFYSLGDAYLQLCINKSPHSKIAESCYEIMEEDAIFHYSGSMGTNLPENEKAQLAKWKTKSMRKKNKR
jgi:hypothetical protein